MTTVEPCSPIVTANGQLDKLTFRDWNFLNHFAGYRRDGLRKREHIILCGVSNEMINNWMEAEDFLKCKF